MEDGDVFPDEKPREKVEHDRPQDRGCPKEADTDAVWMYIVNPQETPACWLGLLRFSDDSRIFEISEPAFSETRLQSVEIQKLVEILPRSSCPLCNALESVNFEGATS
jgi:hypothetical protein